MKTPLYKVGFTGVLLQDLFLMRYFEKFTQVKNVRRHEGTKIERTQHNKKDLAYKSCDKL